MGKNVSALVILVMAMTGVASANPTKLDIAWTGTNGTVVFIHGKANCTDPGLGTYDSRCGNDLRGYWLNSTNDGGDGHDLMDEATARRTQHVVVLGGDQHPVRRREPGDLERQTNDVAACLSDLAAGTNSSGCNPSLIRRTQFRVVGTAWAARSSIACSRRAGGRS